MGCSFPKYITNNNYIVSTKETDKKEKWQYDSKKYIQEPSYSISIESSENKVLPLIEPIPIKIKSHNDIVHIENYYDQQYLNLHDINMILKKKTNEYIELPEISFIQHSYNKYSSNSSSSSNFYYLIDE